MYKLYCHYTDGSCFCIVDERDSGLWGATSSGAVAPAAGWLASTADLPLPSSTSDAAASAAFFYGWHPSRGGPLSLSKGWQERGQQADERQVGADPVHGFDAGGIGQLAEQSSPYAPHAESEAEEQA